MNGRIALFQHHPECSVDCATGMYNALDSDYEFVTFDEQGLTAELLSTVDIIAFPGGIGDADSYYSFIGRRAGNLIEQFVNNGGHYLGICMGAYWAGHHYLDILDGVKCQQYIKRPDADLKRSFGTVVPVKWLGQDENVYFYDGAVGGGDTDKFDVIATYANGEPAAIIQGRVGLIGPHPESLEYWYNPPYGYPRLKDHWHKGRHHALLLDFVNRLMQK